VSYVTGDMTDADTWSKQQIEAVIAALAAEAGRPDPQAGKTLVAEGRKLIADGDRCGSCHRFGDNEMDLGTAPDLTGWGSREWLVGIINDPTHERFYGDTNDRMPNFGVAKEGAAAMLTSQQVGLIADWLRETWYQPAAAVAAH
jgi:mono/diheme cytochrome c family protein